MAQRWIDILYSTIVCMDIWEQDVPKFGCGTGVFFLENEQLFFPVCKLHDIEYDTEGPDISRRRSDRLFFQRMRQLAGGVDGWLRRMWAYVRAIVYVVLVTLFGALFYKKKNHYSSEQLAEYEGVVEQWFG